MLKFNNREIAIICWSIVVLVWVLSKADLRKNITRLVTLFFQYKVLTPYLLAVIYTLVGVAILQHCGLWTNKQLKDTFVWCTFTVVSTIFKLLDTKSGTILFKDALKEIFKFSLILEFVLGVYTFNIIAELILVALAVLFGGMLAVSEDDTKYDVARKFLKNLVVLFGLFLAGYTFYEIIAHFKEFASLDTLRDFILSPLLAIWIIPFIYCLWLSMTYEVYFIPLSLALKNQKKLLRYAKVQSVLQFNVDTKGFERWKNTLLANELKNKEDVRASIREIKRLQKIEKNPPPVDITLGWSPYISKDFLTAEGLITGYYTNGFDEWFAVSQYMRLDDEVLGNSISYQVYGDEKVVKNLELTFIVHNPQSVKSAIQRFRDIAKCLYYSATNQNLPEKVETSIARQVSGSFTLGKVKVEIEKQIWDNKKNFSIKFLIVHV